MRFCITVGQAFRKAFGTAFFRALAANAVTGIAVGTIGPACGVAALGGACRITRRAALRRTGAADIVPRITAGALSPPLRMRFTAAVGQARRARRTGLGCTFAADTVTGITVGGISPARGIGLAVAVAQAGAVTRRTGLGHAFAAVLSPE